MRKNSIRQEKPIYFKKKIFFETNQLLNFQSINQIYIVKVKARIVSDEMRSRVKYKHTIISNTKKQKKVKKLKF